MKNKSSVFILICFLFFVLIHYAGTPDEIALYAQQPDTPQTQEEGQTVPQKPPEAVETQPQPSDQPSQPEIKQQDIPEPTLKPPIEKKRERKKGGEVSFNFDDADVFSVIQTIFGDVLRVNYIIDPQVKGRVNFRSVAPVPIDDVLPLMEVILRLNGIGIVEESGLYRIIPIGDIPKEPAPVGIGRVPEEVQITGKALLQVVPIHFIQSSEIIKILTPFLSKNAVIVDVPKSNYIIIVDTDANVKRLLQLVSLLDSEQLKRIKPEVFVYPVQNGKAEDIAAILQQIFLGAKQTAPARRTVPSARTDSTLSTPVPQPTPSQSQQIISPEGAEALVSEITRIFHDKITNTLIILATPDDYDLISDTIKKIDIVPRQVLIEGIIAQVQLKDDLSFGIAWSLKSDVNFSLKPFNKDFSLKSEMGQNPSIIAGEGGATLSGSGFTFVGLDAAGIVRARLEALAEENKLEVLASPHILVLDNREARIQVGQQLPVPTSETNVTGTVSIQRTFQYRDIGIILNVKPQINDSGLVSLEITQEVSSSDISSKEIATGSIPVLTKTEAKTNLVAQDGQTIVIGGLIREDTSKAKTGIPFLSKIPIIGYLFGSTSKAKSRTELVILLTPHVIRNQKDAGSITSEYIEKFRNTLNINKTSKDKSQKVQSDKDTGDKENKEKAP